jgi:microcystin-dependent protein
LAAGSLPPLCVWPNGQNLARANYAALFGALGTVYGAGDGVSTFGVPDMRGRSLFALDNLGGTAASRITSAVSGLDGATLGAAGGDQRLATHGHTATQAAHNHTITDPGHVHILGGTGLGAGSTGYSGQPGGAYPTNSATTGITINNATPAITVDNFSGGASANIPPAMMCAYALFAGA